MDYVVVMQVVYSLGYFIKVLPDAFFGDVFLFVLVALDQMFQITTLRIIHNNVQDLTLSEEVPIWDNILIGEGFKYLDLLFNV